MSFYTYVFLYTYVRIYVYVRTYVRTYATGYKPIKQKEGLVFWLPAGSHYPLVIVDGLLFSIRPFRAPLKEEASVPFLFRIELMSYQGSEIGSSCLITKLT